MKKLNRILACVDLSHYSKATMEYALTLARGLDLEIIVLNVINSRDITSIGEISDQLNEEMSIEDYVERTRRIRYRKLGDMIGEMCGNDMNNISIHVTVGVPFKSILATIDNEEIDLVVISNKGRENVPGIRFGVNAEKVFRHSPVPVLSVRQGESFHR